MPFFTKESLENLRQKVDLVDVMSSHMDLKRSGASYKALCPFHDEKTPSLMIQKGDTHYHCFGCGAHGDAIQFLMAHLKMGFSDAIESLAQRFHVPLDYQEGTQEQKGPSKSALKEALDHACRFYHFILLHTPEGHEVLQYLFKRGIDLDFIRQFQIGLAPKAYGMMRKTLHAKFVSDENMEAAGLITAGKDGGWREFFNERITFPIRDAAGAVIGFSARKYLEETYGGKYINTTETVLFKKSRVLFGLNYCRRRIAKERKAIIVEGQIDALRLIQAGFAITVAGQGTAFGESHAKELMNLGVAEVYLAMDADNAGQEATVKIGNIFQKEGIDVKIIQLPIGADPDSFLRAHGADAFIELMKNSGDYLTFLVKHHSRTHDLNSPASKTQLIQLISKQVREWDQPVMVQETMRKLAHLMQVTEESIGVSLQYNPNLYIKKSAYAGSHEVNADRVVEVDFLRWLILFGNSQETFIPLAKANISPGLLIDPPCRQIYETFLNTPKMDMLTLATQIDEGQAIVTDICQKKINREKIETQFNDSMQKILDRHWMREREDVRMKIQTGQCSDDEVSILVKQFDVLKKNPPKLVGCQV